MKTNSKYNRWYKLMNYPLKFIPISDLKWPHPKSKIRKEIYDMTVKDMNYHRWLLLTLKTPLKDISLENLQWASEQPYNSLTSKNIFLAEIERRKHDQI